MARVWGRSRRSSSHHPPSPQRRRRRCLGDGPVGSTLLGPSIRDDRFSAWDGHIPSGRRSRWDRRSQCGVVAVHWIAEPHGIAAAEGTARTQGITADYESTAAHGIAARRRPWGRRRPETPAPLHTRPLRRAACEADINTFAPFLGQTRADVGIDPGSMRGQCGVDLGLGRGRVLRGLCGVGVDSGSIWWLHGGDLGLTLRLTGRSLVEVERT